MAIGKFCWFDLSTSDIGKAKAFYGELFGWKIDDDPRYHHIKNAKDQFIGGMMPPPAPGIPPHWLGYVQVGNLDETVARIEKGGGSLVMPPHSFDSGRFAVFRDPLGIVLAAYEHTKPSGGAEADPREPGNFCWSDMASPDPARSAKFVCDVFGWTVEKVDMGGGMAYHLLKLGDAQVGGAMAPPPGSSFPPAWSHYVGTSDIDASTKKAASLGAHVIVPPTPIPNIGRFSVIADPTGAVVSLFQGG